MLGDLIDIIKNAMGEIVGRGGVINKKKIITFIVIMLFGMTSLGGYLFKQFKMDKKFLNGEYGALGSLAITGNMNEYNRLDYYIESTVMENGKTILSASGYHKIGEYNGEMYLIGRNYKGYLSTDRVSVVRIKVNDISKVKVSSYVNKEKTKDYGNLTKNLNWHMNRGKDNCEYIKDKKEKDKIIKALL